MRLHGRQALELEQAAILELEAAAPIGQHADEIGAEDAARRGQALQTHGLEHGPAEDVAGQVLDLAGCEPDARDDRRNRLCRIRIGREFSLDIERRGEPGERRGERREDSVTGVLDDVAAVPVDDLAQQGVVQHLERVGRFLADARARRGRVDPIRAQDDEEVRGHSVVHDTTCRRSAFLFKAATFGRS